MRQLNLRPNFPSQSVLSLIILPERDRQSRLGVSRSFSVRSGEYLGPYTKAETAVMPGSISLFENRSRRCYKMS
jgi:hypothetical protein